MVVGIWVAVCIEVAVLVVCRNWVVVVWVEVAVLVVCRNWVVGDETMFEGPALAAHR